MEKQLTFMTWQHTFACCLSRNPTVILLSMTWISSLNSFASTWIRMVWLYILLKLGERLIQYCEVELKVCASRVTRARVIVRKLIDIRIGLDGREALWGDKTSPIVLPADFEKIDIRIVSYCRKKGNKQTTLHYKQWICGRFLKNLSSSGCEKAEDISGDMVQLAFFAIKVFSVLGTNRPISAVPL